MKSSAVTKNDGINWKYYQEIADPQPGSLISEFENMELSELGDLAEAMEENHQQDIDQAKSFIYAHYYIYSRTGNLGDLNTAIESLQKLLQGSEVNAGDAAYDPLLRDLTVMRTKMAGHTRSPEKLDAAMSNAQELLSVTNYLHPDICARTNAFTNMLSIFAAATGNRGPLNDMIAAGDFALREAMTVILLALEDPGGVLANPKVHIRKLKDALGFSDNRPDIKGTIVILLARLTGTGWAMEGSDDPARINEAIAVLEMSVPFFAEGTSPLCEWEAKHYSLLAMLFGIRYDIAPGVQTDLDLCIRYHERAAVVSIEDLALHRRSLVRLSEGLSKRYLASGRASDAKRAARILERLLTKLDPADKLLPECHNHIAVVLVREFDRSSKQTAEDFKSLDRAIALGLGIIPHARRNSPRHPKAPEWIFNLSKHLLTRYMLKENIKDLNSSVQFAQEAISLCRRGDALWFECVSHYVRTIQRRFERLADSEDLNKAIQKAEEALSNDNSYKYLFDRLWILSSLSWALMSRFKITGDEEAINDSVGYAEQVVELCPEGHSDRGGFLSNLSNTYLQRYDIFADFDDLGRAIEAMRQVVDLAPARGERRKDALLNLANCLRLRFNTNPTAFPDDIDGAVSHAEAAKATSNDNTLKARECTVLSHIFHAKWKRTGGAADLERAISAVRDGITASPAGSPETASFKHWLANILLKREPLEPETAIEAIAICREVMEMDEAEPMSRIQCAELAIPAFDLKEFGTMEDVAEIAERAVQLLPTVSSRALRQRDQQRRLKSFFGLCTEAVSFAFLAGRSPEYCLELLEFGRGIINGLKFDTRTDLADLEREHPQLARKFANIRNQLDATDAGPSHPSLGDDHGVLFRSESDDGRRHNITNQFNDVVKDIRNKHGFDGFMKPTSSAELAKVSNSSMEAVVVVNCWTPCDAIILQDGKIRHLPLPDLEKHDVDRSVQIMKTIRQSFLGGGRRLTRILVWLWKTVVGPVLDFLGYTDQPALSGEKWPRVWWVPTGGLTQLPLHAAGYHSSKYPGQSALDRVVSSYSPSVKALMYTRQNLKRTTAAAASEPPGHRTQPDKIILVSMDKTPAVNDLEFADREIDELEQLLPSGRQVDKLRRPSKAELMRSLASRCSVFHFAGHGQSNPLDPAESCLLLRDWQTNPFTVNDLVRLDLHSHRPPWLAYLSACSTGEIQDEELYDESIHLVSACQGAGFQHVIGSLWEVSDLYSLTTAKAVYGSLSDGRGGSGGFGTTGDVALALHEAVRQLRELTTSGGGDRSGQAGDHEPESSLPMEEGIEWDGFLAEEEGTPSHDTNLSRDPIRSIASVKAVSSFRIKGDPMIWAAYIHVGM